MINKDNYFASQSEISSSLVADDKSALMVKEYILKFVLTVQVLD